MAELLLFTHPDPAWQALARQALARWPQAHVVDTATLEPALPVYAAPGEARALAVYERVRQENARQVLFACPPEYAFHTVQAQVCGVHRVCSELLSDAAADAMATYPEDCHGAHPLLQCRMRWCRDYVWKHVHRSPQPMEQRLPKVSVCVAHYNHGDHLPACLQGLAAQDYPHLEVLIMDDGSRDAASLEVFAAMERQYPGWRFLRQQNQGPGAARNSCARAASGELLLFADADNISLPHMISRMVQGLQASGADALACHFGLFRDDPLFPHALGAPQGGNLAAGMLENVFGDTNFMVKADVFRALGGFSPRRDLPEDWEFLARLNLAGYYQEVLPEALFLYRDLPAGRGKGFSVDGQRLALLETYGNFLPPFAASAMEQMLLPYAGQHLPLGRSVILRAALGLGWKLERLYHRCFPAKSGQAKFMHMLRKGKL